MPGLRREEVALLAGISVEYYLRLEQGRDQHPSDQVLDAIARALRLDPDAETYLRDLAGSPTSGCSCSPTWRRNPALTRAGRTARFTGRASDRRPAMQRGWLPAAGYPRLVTVATLDRPRGHCLPGRAVACRFQLSREPALGSPTA